MRRFVLPALLIVLMAQPAWAWNAFGHKVAAAIAYADLKPESRAAVAKLLRSHPAYTRDDWPRRQATSDPDLNLFLYASYFADEARDRNGPYATYHEPTAHYINFPYVPKLNGRPLVPPPTRDIRAGITVLSAYPAKLSVAEDPSAAPEARALAASWLFHLVGDIHQPMHTVGRFCPATPQGDRGGNDVEFPNPRSRYQNLHAFWDDVLGSDDDADSVKATAEALRAKYPRSALFELESVDTFEGWAQESFTLVRKVAYRGIDPTVKVVKVLPPGYEDDARKVAERRVVLAGYRLADVLKDIPLP